MTVSSTHHLGAFLLRSRRWRMFGIEEKSQETIFRERLDQLEDLFEDIKQEYFIMARNYDSVKAQIEEVESDALDREDRITDLEKELERRSPSSCGIPRNIREAR